MRPFAVFVLFCATDAQNMPKSRDCAHLAYSSMYMKIKSTKLLSSIYPKIAKLFNPNSTPATARDPSRAVVAFAGIDGSACPIRPSFTRACHTWPPRCTIFLVRAPEHRRPIVDDGAPRLSRAPHLTRLNFGRYPFRPDAEMWNPACNTESNPFP